MAGKECPQPQRCPYGLTYSYPPLTLRFSPILKGLQRQNQWRIPHSSCPSHTAQSEPLACTVCAPARCLRNLRINPNVLSLQEAVLGCWATLTLQLKRGVLTMVTKFWQGWPSVLPVHRENDMTPSTPYLTPDTHQGPRAPSLVTSI